MFGNELIKALNPVTLYFESNLDICIACHTFSRLTNLTAFDI